MTEHPGRKTGLFLVLVFAASSLMAENIKNWSAPATWRPTAAGGAHALGDVTNALPFIGLDPCRIVDTRGNGAPIQGGIFAASELRNYAVAGICAIPTAARALSLNITVTGPGQTGAGFLLAFPTGGVPPPVSSLNWDHAPATVGNAAVVPTNASVSFAINVSGPTHVIIDINGYYPTGDSGNLLNLGQHFDVSGNTDPPFGMITTRNNSAATGAMGIFGIEGAATGRVYALLGNLETSPTAGAAAVAGFSGGGPPSLNFLTCCTSPGGISLFAGNTGNYGIYAISSFITGKFVNMSAAGTDRSEVYLAEGSDAARFFGNVAINAFAGQLGNLSVAGTLSKGAGAFKIDHPLDPENKYLYHSFVESPDMMNIYNGNVVLDHNGKAVVKLPDYFEALNMDFRYQLTSIGKFSAVYVDEEIQGNEFRIAGGRPFGKISWQVTGIRQDKFANAHRIQVEVEKEEAAKGFYLHPEEYGKAPEMSLVQRVHQADVAKTQGTKEVDDKNQ